MVESGSNIGKIEPQNAGKGPSLDRLFALVEETRAATGEDCSATVTAKLEEGTVILAPIGDGTAVLVPEGKIPELAKFPSDKTHIIFPPGEKQASPGSEPTNGKKKKRPEVNEAIREKKERRAKNLSMFSGRMGKTVYENGRPVNVKEGNGKKHRKNNRKNGSH